MVDFLNEDIILIILNHINTRKIRYQPFGDGEQTYSLIYHQLYPYNCVNRLWNNLIHNNKNTLKL